MIKKIMFSFMLFSINVAMFASTPVVIGNNQQFPVVSTSMHLLTVHVQGLNPVVYHVRNGFVYSAPEDDFEIINAAAKILKERNITQDSLCFRLDLINVLGIELDDLVNADYEFNDKIVTDLACRIGRRIKNSINVR